jgi:hypothetical protein
MTLSLDTTGRIPSTVAFSKFTVVGWDMLPCKDWTLSVYSLGYIQVRSLDQGIQPHLAPTTDRYEVLRLANLQAPQRLSSRHKHYS